MGNTSDDVMMEGPIKSRLVHQAHENKIYHEQTQPSEKLILERNQQLRNNPGALKDLSFGRKIADIPMIMIEKAKRQGFDIMKSEKDLMAWLQTSDGKLCMVQDTAPKYHQGGI